MWQICTKPERKTLKIAKDKMCHVMQFQQSMKNSENLNIAGRKTFYKG